MRLVLNNNGDICLAGNNDRGTLYAVYDFLKLQGCGWFIPGPAGEIVATRSRLAIVSGSRIESPDYDVRGMTIGSAQFIVGGGWINLNADDYFDWCLRNRVNAFLCMYSKTEDFLAHRGYSHIQTTNHSWATFLLDNHPEWWPLVNGVRLQTDPGGGPNQLCVSNQALRDYVVNYILTFFANNPDVSIFGLSAMDSTAYWCECQYCRALDSDGGTGPWVKGIAGIPAYPALPMSDRSVNFVNEIAARVAAVYPGKKIEMYAYSSTREPPTRENVNPNVLIKYTYHGAPVNRPILDTSISFNATTADWLNNWQSHGASSMGLYDYGNFFHPDSPNFWFYHTADMFKSLNEQWGIRHALGECDHSFVTSLMWYNLRARCMWNKDVDPMAEVNDICTRFYGPAAQNMYAYYLFMHCRQMTSNNWQDPDSHTMNLSFADYNVPVMEKARAILEAAKVHAGNDETVKQRIDFARFGHAYMTLEVAKNENPITNSSKKATGDAFKLANGLASKYWTTLLMRQGGPDILNSLWFMPFWQVWDRSVDWTATKNPDDDALGNNVWSYQTVERGNALGQANPWYTQACSDMVWNSSYWKTAVAGSAPLIQNTYIENYVSKSQNPMVRWVNSTSYPLLMKISGNLTVRWLGSPCSTNVDVAIVSKNAANGNFTPLLAQTLLKPTSGTDVVISVDPVTVEINPNDEIRVTMRQTNNASTGTLDFYDDLTFNVVAPQPRYCGDDGTVYLAADISGPEGIPDCYIDLYDLEALAAQWMQQCDLCECLYLSVGDIGGPAGVMDLKINLFDTAALAQQWMKCNDPANSACDG